MSPPSGTFQQCWSHEREFSSAGFPDSTPFYPGYGLPAFVKKPTIEGRPKLAAWWGKIQERESTKKVLAEQGAALEALQKQQQGG